MTIDRESLRPAFERWVVANVREPINTVGRMPSGRYWMTEVQTAWLAYCAAFESLGEPVGHFLDVKRHLPNSPRYADWQQVSDEHVGDMDVVPLYRLPEVKK